MRILTIVAAIILVLHGLIHLMGTAAYMKLAVIQQLPFKTTVLGGRWDLGANGTAVYGALWAVAAIGFVGVAFGLLAGWSWWPPVLLGIAFFSLVITVLDWGVAYAGVIVNIGILAALWLGPRIISFFSR